MKISEATALDDVGISKAEGDRIVNALGNIFIKQGIPRRVLMHLKAEIYSNIEDGSVYYDLVIKIKGTEGGEYRRRISAPLYEDEAIDIAREFKAWVTVLGMMK